MACVTIEIYDMQDVLDVPIEANGCLLVFMLDHVECITFLKIKNIIQLMQKS